MEGRTLPEGLALFVLGTPLAVTEMVTFISGHPGEDLVVFTCMYAMNKKQVLVSGAGAAKRAPASCRMGEQALQSQCCCGFSS